MRATIYYDGECPFCTRYAEFQRLQEVLESLDLVDLRTAAEDRARLRQLGFDLDAGMVLELDGELFGGADAALRLTSITKKTDVPSRLLRFSIGTRLGAKLLYPLLRLGRNASHLTLGRSPFASSDERTMAWQMLFCTSWGLFAFLHSLSYAVQYYATMYWTTWAILPLSHGFHGTSFGISSSRRSSCR